MKAWSKRQLAQAKLSDAQHRASLPAYEQAAADMDYGDTLPPGAKVWLRAFTEEFYGGRFEANGRKLHRGELQKECRRRTRGHAKDRRPDLMSFSKEHQRADVEQAAELPAPGGGEDALIDYLDGKRFADWQRLRFREIKEATELNLQLRQAKNALRYVRTCARLAKSQ